MIYKTLTEIRQSELNADCGKGFSHCCLTEQDSYTGRASAPALWESINCEVISNGSLQIMKALIARGWTAIGVEIARTDYQTQREGVAGTDFFSGGYLYYATASRFVLVIDNGTLRRPWEWFSHRSSFF